jgi:hypothetical protein
MAAYKWRQVSGPTTVTFNTSVAKPSVIFSISGTYVFGLIVTDNEGGVSTEDVVQITVGAANQKPKANAGPDQILKLPGTAMLNLKTIYENKGYALACYIRLSHI